MKTATLPSLRVEPELRQAAEDVLEEGESLSALVESAVRRDIQRRKIRKDFLAKAMRAKEEAERTGIYYSVDEVREGLNRIIEDAERPKH